MTGALAVPATPAPDTNDSCNLNESADLLEDKHKNINCMIRKTLETSYKSSSQVSAALMPKEKQMMVPRLVMPIPQQLAHISKDLCLVRSVNEHESVKSDNIHSTCWMPKVDESCGAQPLTLTPVRLEHKDREELIGTSCYLDLESLKTKFHTELNAKVQLPRRPLFADDEQISSAGKTEQPKQLMDSERKLSSSRHRHRDRASNVAIRASRLNLGSNNTLLKGNARGLEDSQSEFLANEALPSRILRETKPKATMEHLRRSNSITGTRLASRIQRVPTGVKLPEPQTVLSTEGNEAGKLRASESSQSLRQALEDFSPETSRSLKSAQKKFGARVIRSFPCLAFYVDTPAGKLPAARVTASNPADHLVLYFHSNGEDLTDLFWLGEYIHEKLNTNFLAVEYPGYGCYEGQPSEEAILLDAEILLGFVCGELQLKLENIVVVGRSLGSGPAVYLASHYELKGLVLASAFTSIKDVVKDKFGSLISAVVSDKFNNLERIVKAKCPVCIVHGNDDQMVKPEHARKLAGRCC